jgi:hypothetical protein
MADKNANAYKRDRFYVYCHNGNGDGKMMYIGPRYEWVASFDEAFFTCNKDEALKWASWMSPHPFTCVSQVVITVITDPSLTIVVKKPHISAENT